MLVLHEGLFFRASNTCVHFSYFSYLHLCRMWSKLRLSFFRILLTPKFDVQCIGVYNRDLRLLGIAQRSAGNL